MSTKFKTVYQWGQRIDEHMEQIQFLTGSSLKLIAIFSMIIDHTCKIELVH